MFTGIDPSFLAQYDTDHFAALLIPSNGENLWAGVKNNCYCCLICGVACTSAHSSFKHSISVNHFTTTKKLVSHIAAFTRVPRQVAADLIQVQDDVLFDRAVGELTGGSHHDLLQRPVDASSNLVVSLSQQSAIAA